MRHVQKRCRLTDSWLAKRGCPRYLRAAFLQEELPESYADNFFLPFALLFAKTFLPFAVNILLRKPCTLAWDFFFGWNVIFMSKTPPSRSFLRYIFSNDISVYSTIIFLKSQAQDVGVIFHFAHIFLTFFYFQEGQPYIKVETPPKRVVFVEMTPFFW